MAGRTRDFSEIFTEFSGCVLRTKLSRTQKKFPAYFQAPIATACEQRNHARHQPTFLTPSQIYTFSILPFLTFSSTLAHTYIYIHSPQVQLLSTPFPHKYTHTHTRSRRNSHFLSETRRNKPASIATRLLARSP